MILNVDIDDQSYAIEVPDEMVGGATEMFARMDADMDKGWQMSRTWVAEPDAYQRGQIVGDKILGAFETENKKMLLMMAAYILNRLPKVTKMIINTEGDMTETELLTE